MNEINETTKLHSLFKDARIVGIPGNKNTGKTNNICQLLKEYLSVNNTTPIYAYGMQYSVMKTLYKYGIKEISSLDQLLGKKNCILVIDEFQKLKLNDRRYKDELNELVDFIYHNNVYLILSSPNIREFNSIIGGIIEKWGLKSIRIDQCINGSQLKKVVEKYKGRHKTLGSIEVEKNELLVINNNYETVLDISYWKEADSKKGIVNLF